ncbi:hypothetical protein MCAP1_003241 [Malassezia caprae]|uniref:DNA-directed RNA polymerase III subunit RPC4 n=1 Tax=Malassezia caprae TaxID=1381934 RepID=A0AAF0EDY7_9BASI|nr:hypothetical protein MCAP1_003241 [Malassezia caprae]
MSEHPEGHAPRRRITGPSTRAPAPGRTMSMVPSRTSAAVGTPATASPVESPATSRSSTPQPSASRIQFRPVMPQRRRTPSATAPAVKSEAEERPKPSRPATRPTPRPPREMTATGPFALGAASSSSSSSRRAAALAAPMRASTPATPTVAATAPAAPVSGGPEARSVDIEHVHELDDMAPQSLMQAPPSIKREASPTKPEPMDEAPDVNESQALDLSDNEDDVEEDTPSFLSSSLQSGVQSGQLFLFQLPQSGLSFQRADAPEDAHKAENGTPMATEGHIGHLDVYPSGRIVLRIGDMPYDVAGGSESSFLQQVMLLDTERQAAECLGELNGKVVVTPQLDYLMERARFHAAS